MRHARFGSLEFSRESAVMAGNQIVAHHARDEGQRTGVLSVGGEAVAFGQIPD